MAISGAALARQMAKQQQEASLRVAGRATSSKSIIAYTPEQEREIKEKPAMVVYRSALQNTDGSFKAAPDPLMTGTTIPGRYGINTFGKYVTY